VAGITWLTGTEYCSAIVTSPNSITHRIVSSSGGDTISIVAPNSITQTNNQRQWLSDISTSSRYQLLTCWRVWLLAWENKCTSSRLRREWSISLQLGTRACMCTCAHVRARVLMHTARTRAHTHMQYVQYRIVPNLIYKQKEAHEDRAGL